MDWNRLFVAFSTGVTPVLPLFVVLGVFLLLVGGPLPGRGPRLSQRRDLWRRFQGESRRAVMSRAGHRCEGPAFLAWGRCDEAATEVDHVYPHAKGGPTVPSNGQALCSGHNRRKGARKPPWWYVLSLERRRRSYFPEGVDVRVSAVMSAADLAAHVTKPTRRPPS